jgi:uncharacterized protein (DUF2267 family)
MQYDEFIDKVQLRSGLESRERLIEITRAALETLGERLDRTVRRGVASQLPSELREMLLSRSDSDQYLLQEFYRRVGARADTKYYDAAERATAVLGVLQEAVSASQLQEMVDSLPSEYSRLFEGSVLGPGLPSLDRS